MPYRVAKRAGGGRLRIKNILVGASVGERHVEMCAGAEIVAERFGHEGCHGADRARDLLGHEAQEDQAVAGLQRVAVGKVELILAVSALLIEGVDGPIELIHVPHHGLEEPDRLHGLVHVIGRGRSQETAGDIGGVSVAGLAIDVQLRLNSNVEYLPCRGRLRQHALENHPGTVRIRFSLVIQITSEPREHAYPRAGR